MLCILVYKIGTQINHLLYNEMFFKFYYLIWGPTSKQRHADVKLVSLEFK